jgi:Rne/Rng family ribonuclease
MPRSLLIRVTPGEAWGALCQDDDLVELAIARLGAARAGRIMFGRIVALDKALPAAFVDIGDERPAFLSAEDAAPRRGIADLGEGQAVVVQVTKAARADKAAGVTLRPRLDGALLDLRPNGGGTHAVAAPTRQRLEEAIATFAAPGEHFVLRATAADATPAALEADAAALRRRWQGIAAACKTGAPPMSLEPEVSPALALLADHLAPPPDRIVIDDRAAFAELRSHLLRHHPPLAPRLSFHAGPAALFDEDGVTAAIETALAPRVPLDGGGALIIESTAAAVTIDVDSGGAPIMAANLAAARAIARQIRLRNLAGPIVIDFIATNRRGDRDTVRVALGDAIAGDPGHPQLLGWTRLGHMELVRPRRHAALDEILFTAGGRVKTALTVALEALAAVARAADARPGRALTVRAAPEVASCLDSGAARAARRALEARLGRAVATVPMPGFGREQVDIANA